MPPSSSLLLGSASVLGCGQCQRRSRSRLPGADRDEQGRRPHRLRAARRALEADPDPRADADAGAIPAGAPQGDRQAGVEALRARAERPPLPQAGEDDATHRHPRGGLQEGHRPGSRARIPRPQRQVGAALEPEPDRSPEPADTLVRQRDDPTLLDAALALDEGFSLWLAAVATSKHPWATSGSRASSATIDNRRRRDTDLDRQRRDAMERERGRRPRRERERTCSRSSSAPVSGTGTYTRRRHRRRVEPRGLPRQPRWALRGDDSRSSAARAARRRRRRRRHRPRARRLPAWR